MKVKLKTFGITPQGKAWCYNACLLNALSIRMWEKFKIKKMFNPEKFFNENFIENVRMEKILKILKTQKMIPKYLSFKTLFKRTLSRAAIKKHIIKRVPLIVQVADWQVENGIIEKGETKGHFLVLYGFDDDFFYLQNPWGEDHYCKLRKQDIGMLGSFTSVI